MNISFNRRDLFKNSTIKDKLNLFQLLFETKSLTADLALALLTIIHQELNDHQKPDRTVFKRYAEAIESLRFNVPDLLQQIVDGWKAHQNVTPEEWFSDDNSDTDNNSAAHQS